MECLLSTPVRQDWEGLVRCILRDGAPERVYHIELFIDREVQEVVCARFGLLKGADRTATDYAWRRELAVQRFLGYDYVCTTLDGFVLPLRWHKADDAAALARREGRSFMEEHAGPITSWDEFEAYPWPDVEAASTRSLEWYSEHLPEDMCIIATEYFGQSAEHLTWLMGYETLCYALYDRRDLVRAISERLLSIHRRVLERILGFERVKVIWGSDDMGFRSGTLIGPADMREFVLPEHRLMAQMAHEAGRPYILHSCGNLSAIMEDLIEDVGIDGRHSFEDVIEPVEEAYRTYSGRISILGGIDMDFLCRAEPEQVRERVRRVLEQCMPRGGYCLGSGNSIANYVPVDSFLAMVDEGRRFSG
jgi:uroporphyrinogen decarboxylase